MFSILFTPIGRYLILGVAILMIAAGIYGKIRADAIAEVKAAATADVLRRTQDAVRAGDAVDVTPDGLLKSDGHKRAD